MTVEDWDRSRKPYDLIRALGNRFSGRKFHLFLCAAGHHLLKNQTNDALRKAVENCERFIDGEMDPSTFLKTEAQLVEVYARDHHQELVFGTPDLILRAILAVLAADTQQSLQTLLESGKLIVSKKEESFDLILCRILRDLFSPPGHEYRIQPRFVGGGLMLPDGKPFQIPESARAIACGVQADQAFDRLPILADALEDADCPDRTWLDHLRHHPLHVRGCWALDLALMKS